MELADTRREDSFVYNSYKLRRRTIEDFSKLGILTSSLVNTMEYLETYLEVLILITNLIIFVSYILLMLLSTYEFHLTIYDLFDILGFIKFIIINVC